MKISFITTIENLLNPFEILDELNCIPLALCTEGLLFIGGERSTVPYNQRRCAFILGRALIMALEFNSTVDHVVWMELVVVVDTRRAMAPFLLFI
jgi:hypothetical protein